MRRLASRVVFVNDVKEGELTFEIGSEYFSHVAFLFFDQRDAANENCVFEFACYVRTMLALHALRRLYDA